MAAVRSLLYLGYVGCAQAAEHQLIPVFLDDPFLKVAENQLTFSAPSFPPFLPLMSSNMHVPVEDVVVSKEGRGLPL